MINGELYKISILNIHPQYRDNKLDFIHDIEKGKRIYLSNGEVLLLLGMWKLEEKDWRYYEFRFLHKNKIIFFDSYTDNEKLMKDDFDSHFEIVLYP